MELDGKTVLLCDCMGTMPLDRAGLEKALTALGGTGAFAPNTQLCRAQLEAFQKAAAGDAPLLVACTQEAPLFDEVRDEALADAGTPEEDAGSPPSYVNIRENAGWSKDAASAGPKIAALIAEAALDLDPAGTVTMTSEGTALVYGRDETAIEAGRRLAGKLDVTVLLSRPEEVVPPRLMDVPVFRGTIVAARGHLGAFEITVNDYAPAIPASRGVMTFEDTRNGAASRCDVILDMTGERAPLTAPEKRDGFFKVDPGDPAALERAIAEMGEMTGEFEKPRYVRYRGDICAHGRSSKTGCTRCLDVCPAGAIVPNGDEVSIDPFVCGGCGLCSAVCPTGAAAYQLPAGDGIWQRLRTLLGAYADVGGPSKAGAPVLLLHDNRSGADSIAMMARFGRGLPARVLPFPVNEVSQIGFDVFAVAAAYGAAAVRVLVPPARREEIGTIANQVGLAESLLSGLGYGSGRIGAIDEADPDKIEAILWDLPKLPQPEPARFLPMGGKRSVTMLALRHLHQHAPEPVDLLPLAAGAPFGNVQVDADGCTLCLACVGACPTGALLDNPDRPQLSFVEDACVQCGLCKTTCPEQVIALEPRLNFTPDARSAVVKNEEEPFHCVRCGKPFGTRGMIETIIDKLSGKHWMFTQSEQAERIMMCDDCRVIVQFDRGNDPFASAPRPMPRTTEDYIRENERDEARAAAGMAPKKPDTRH